MYHVISEKLKEAMRIKNVNLNQLTETCDIPYETLRNLYYAKNKNPRVETLYSVCKALDITMDYLTGLTKYNNDEMEMLVNYQKCGKHGKDFLSIIARFEADYTLALNKRKNNDNINYINCLIPEGPEEDGFEYTSCRMEKIECIYEEACMAIKITTDNFIPIFLRGDILAIANRYPKEGETAIYYKDGKTYIRQYKNENGKVILKSVTRKGEDIIIDSFEKYEVLGTYINVIR